MSTPVRTEQRGQVLLITLDRPKANAIDRATSHCLYEVLAQFDRDPALRVAIITGAGERFFSAGWDLKAAAAGEPVDADFGPGGFAGITEFHNLSKPVIAAVNGLAVGGGFELALACDLIVAAEHAQFFLPEAQLGITPDSGGVFRLPRRVPRAVALEMMFTGRRLGAAEAARWGLVNEVVAAPQLMPAALALAERILASAPLALQAVKELVNAGETLTLEQAFARQRSGSLPHYGRMLRSQDAEEGARAFAEGRPPHWQGC